MALVHRVVGIRAARVRRPVAEAVEVGDLEIGYGRRGGEVDWRELQSTISRGGDPCAAEARGTTTTPSASASMAWWKASAARRSSSRCSESWSTCRSCDFFLREIRVALEQLGYDRFVSFEWEKKWHPEIADAEIPLPHFVRWFRERWSREGQLRDGKVAEHWAKRDDVGLAGQLGLLGH